MSIQQWLKGVGFCGPSWFKPSTGRSNTPGKQAPGFLMCIASHNSKKKIPQTPSIYPTGTRRGGPPLPCCQERRQHHGHILPRGISYLLTASIPLMSDEGWGGPSGRRRDYQSIATKALANVYEVLAVAIGISSFAMDSACNINLVIASCGGKTDHLSAAGDPACIHSRRSKALARLLSWCLPPSQQGFR